MTKNDIGIMAAKATGLQQNEVKQVLQLLDGMVEILAQRERLELRGVLEVRHHKPCLLGPQSPYRRRRLRTRPQGHSLPG